MPYSLSLMLSASVCCALVVGARDACAVSFVFTPLNTDGTVPEIPQALNSSDQVVGITHNSKGVSVGFVWSAGESTIVDGSGVLNSISDSGIAVGSPWLNYKNYYVSYNLGSKILTEVPLSIGLHGGQLVSATGINASGEVVGISVAGYGKKFTGFVTVNGQSSRLVPKHEDQSVPGAVNAEGDVIINCGCYELDYSTFVYRKGKFSQIAIPGASITTAGFITASDQVGGSFILGGDASGFLLSHGTYVTYNPSGATSSSVTGVGPSGQVYGTFVDGAGNTHGFVNVSGSYYQIDAPNSKFTEVFGVGKSGSIYGLFQSSSGGAYGYIATCPKKDICTQ